MEIPLATEHDHREHNHDWDKNTKNTFQDQCIYGDKRFSISHMSSKHT